MDLRLYDAHNHLQDERLVPFLPGMAPLLEQEGIAAMVVNGSAESDWARVLQMKERFPQVLPSFGCHPWYVGECSSGWKQNLVSYLDRIPSAMGEIGLDRWIKGHDLDLQVDVFRWQLRVAAERGVPASIHCLQAWGKLLDILRSESLPKPGFVLHSFGGAKETVPELCELGAYFSLPGYFAHERKSKQREAFLKVPLERLLIETDAPDQCLPSQWNKYPATETGTGKPLNHPANLGQVYRFACELFGLSLEQLAARVEANFLRVFGGLVNSKP